MNSEPLISVNALTKRYPGEQSRLVIDHLDLQILPGQIVVIAGRSGSGKSTLLNLIGQMDHADGGEINFRGTNTAEWDDQQRTRFRAVHIGFVFQAFNLLPTLTVKENIALPLEINHQPRQARVEQLLGRLGLAALRDRFPDQISGGEQQRAAIARALVHQPALVIADEPSGNLDHESGQQVIELFESCVREAGAALLMATHSTDMIGHADVVFDLRDGRLVKRES